MNKNILKPIWVIGKNSYREIIRDKLLYGILLIGVLVTASCFFLATISLDQNARIMQNIGMAAITIFSLFICVFVSTNSMSKDLDRRALYLLFSKPISKAQYVLGKYLGMVLLLLTTLGILGGIFVVGSLFTDRSVIIPSLINLGYAFMELSFVIAIAILFASFTAPLNASLYTLSFYIIGHSMEMLKKFAFTSGSKVSIWLIDFCYYLLPNLEKFNVRTSTLYHLQIPASNVIGSVFYWLIYTAFILGLAVVVTNKREV